MVENLFWMGRYSERAESATRLLRTTFMQLNSASTLPDSVRHQLLQSVTEVTGTQPGFSPQDPQTFDDPETELLNVILDSGRFGSVCNNVQAMLSCTEEAREMLSGDTHRVLSDLRDTLNDLPAQLQPDSLAAPEEALDPLITSLLALSGLSQESMIRGFGWRFLEMGRRLERTLQTTLLLRALLVPVLDDDAEEQLLEAALMCGEVLVTYRRRYRSQPELRNALVLLLLDRSNPRSLQVSAGPADSASVRVAGWRLNVSAERRAPHIAGGPYPAAACPVPSNWPSWMIRDSARHWIHCSASCLSA